MRPCRRINPQGIHSTLLRQHQNFPITSPRVVGPSNSRDRRFIRRFALFPSVAIIFAMAVLRNRHGCPQTQISPAVSAVLRGYGSPSQPPLFHAISAVSRCRGGDPQSRISPLSHRDSPPTNLPLHVGFGISYCKHDIVLIAIRISVFHSETRFPS
jgi:hypothetical protein